jgi:hypothetical protein
VTEALQLGFNVMFRIFFHRHHQRNLRIQGELKRLLQLSPNFFSPYNHFSTMSSTYNNDRFTRGHLFDLTGKVALVTGTLLPAAR